MVPVPFGPSCQSLVNSHTCRVVKDNSWSKKTVLFGANSGSIDADIAYIQSSEIYSGRWILLWHDTHNKESTSTVHRPQHLKAYTTAVWSLAILKLKAGTFLKQY